MPPLDFDGDYGRNYRQSILNSCPGHDVLHEIALAAVQWAASDARQVLVVGPGPGDELLPLLNACPEAALTVLEPSGQMLEQCHHTLADQPGRERCRLLQHTLNDAIERELNSARFDVVICHNVLHILPGEEQTVMLQQLTQCTADGGHLLLSAYSEAINPESKRLVFKVAKQRLMNRGVLPERLEAIVKARNTSVFSLDPRRLSNVLAQAGWQSPVQLYQGLFNRLWLCRPQR